MVDLQKLSEQLNTDRPDHKFEVVSRKGKLKIKVDGRLARYFATSEKMFEEDGDLKKFHNIDPVEEFSKIAIFELESEGAIEATMPETIKFREMLKKGPPSKS
jgi:hypothetical protein